LLNYVLFFAMESKIKKCFVRMKKENLIAKKLFLKFGFKIKPDDFNTDVVVMEKFL